MKELRSTEILDREIEEDARKKAERILKNADEEAQKIAAAVEGRVKEPLEARRAGLEADYSRFVRDQEAILPLDHIRYLASFEDSAITKALDAYLRSLPPEKKEAILAEQLVAYRSLLEGQQVTAECFGFDEKAAVELVEKNSGARVSTCTVLEGENVSAHLPPSREGITARAGIVVETLDKGMRCRATLDEKVESIMETCNYELAETLFGGRLPA